MQILEIIGLSKVPLSSRQIEKEWTRSFSADRNTENSYIYEIIKKLHKPRFLKVSYKETAIEKIRNIQPTENDDWDRELKILPITITDNPRNWRYRLNLKGFLLYLKLVDENDQVDTRKINSIITNLSNYEEFDFLNYFAIFGNADKVKLLVEIVRELKSNLNTYSREYLSYYIIKRCYEEISIWLAIQDNILIKKFSRLMKKKEIEDTNELLAELRNCKFDILDELIPIALSILEFMMIDRIKTKQSILNIEK